MIPDYAIEIVTDPTASYPVTTAELVNELRDNAPDDDSQLAAYIHTATLIFEKRTGRTIRPTVFKQWVLRLPTELQRAPVTAVSTVTAYGSDDTGVTITDTRADTFQTPTPVYRTTQPFFSYGVGSDLALSTKRRYPVSVQFTAGYATVPDDIKTAIKLCAVHLWQHRGDTDAELPPGFVGLCNLYTVRGFVS